MRHFLSTQSTRLKQTPQKGEAPNSQREPHTQPNKLKPKRPAPPKSPRHGRMGSSRTREIANKIREKQKLMKRKKKTKKTENCYAKTE
ncbi:hypothetical protein PRUPE_6G360000 [Prunus persica]|uniref:Uncharacterized protein n=1 Tax=Prunus persica TaxID=3760 RepID=A0A251P0W1_PRUPE|nr:hypothetical protein PRUPE_6G360000 [Prunus persica]